MSSSMDGGVGRVAIVAASFGCGWPGRIEEDEPTKCRAVQSRYKEEEPCGMWDAKEEARVIVETASVLAVSRVRPRESCGCHRDTASTVIVTQCGILWPAAVAVPLVLAAAAFVLLWMSS